MKSPVPCARSRFEPGSLKPSSPVPPICIWWWAIRRCSVCTARSRSWQTPRSTATRCGVFLRRCVRNRSSAAFCPRRMPTSPWNWRSTAGRVPCPRLRGHARKRRANRAWPNKFGHGNRRSTLRPAGLQSPSGGSGSSGRTPYRRSLARPHGQPPKVTSVSMRWSKRASLLPFLARVQTGHRFSQKSGSNVVRRRVSSVISLFLGSRVKLKL